MSAIDFLMGVHSHQPVGNFGHVFEMAYETCYKPQIEILEKHPGVRVALHHSGPLLEWMENNRPKYLDLVGKMAERGQVEILSGGFYEPILSAIPEDDAIGQIVMMNEYIQKRFGYEPKGMWLAERIWDPYMPRIISAAGLKFTLLDDTHFYYAGLQAKDMFGYYITEKHGATLAVFPIDKNLRYTIPFRYPAETIAYFKKLKEEDKIEGVTYGDDGEKFGLWPDTYKWIYEDKWLENFYTAIEDNADIVKTTLFSEFLEKSPALGRIYLPMASYEEMMEWTLPAEMGVKFSHILHELTDSGKREDWKPFIRGGLWDNFLAKYDESNRMHKKMLHVSRKLRAATTDEKAAKKLATAKQEMYRGQCNCSYWHGLFGGLYLNYLRHAVYDSLIKSENAMDKALRKAKQWMDVERFDFDMDGSDDVVFSNQTLNAYFDPNCGGSMVELDYRPACFALTNTLTRRPEAYHEKIKQHAAGGGQEAGTQPASIHDLVRMKEEGLGDFLNYDKGNRRNFQDRFIAADTDMATFASGKFTELGDFAYGDYDIVAVKEGSKGAFLELQRQGFVTLQGIKHKVAVRKVFGMNKKDGGVLTASYTITNNSVAHIACVMGTEFNMTLLAADADDRYWVLENGGDKQKLKESGAETGVKNIGMRDDWFKFQVNVESADAVNVWRFPVETVSQSEGGFERTYQGSCIVMLRNIDLAPGKSAKFELTLSVNEAK